VGLLSGCGRRWHRGKPMFVELAIALVSHRQAQNRSKSGEAAPPVVGGVAQRETTGSRTRAGPAQPTPVEHVAGFTGYGVVKPHTACATMPQFASLPPLPANDSVAGS